MDLTLIRVEAPNVKEIKAACPFEVEAKLSENPPLNQRFTCLAKGTSTSLERILDY